MENILGHSVCVYTTVHTKCRFVFYHEIIEITFTLLQQPMTILKSSRMICMKQNVSLEYLVGMPFHI